MNREWMRTSEAARHFGVTRRTIAEWVKDGRLPTLDGWQAGAWARIPASVLDDLKEAQMPRDEWMTSGEAAKVLRVSPKTLHRWAKDGLFPSHTTLGGHRRYLRSQVERAAQGAWLEVCGSPPSPHMAKRIERAS